MEVKEEDPDAEGAGEMQAREAEQQLHLVQVQQERRRGLSVHDQDTANVQVRFFARSDVERRQSPDHDEICSIERIRTMISKSL